MSVSFYVAGGATIVEEGKCQCTDGACPGFINRPKWECPLGVHGQDPECLNDRLADEYYDWGCANPNKWIEYVRGKGCPHCPRCKGEGIVIYEYSKEYLNLSNGNFRLFADTIGLPYNEETLTGKLEEPELSRVYREVVKTLNNERKAKLLLETKTLVDGNTIWAGKSVEHWLDNLEELLEAIKDARRLKSYIHYG